MSNEKDSKLKALKLTLDKLDKAYGKGTVMKMSDQAVVDVEAIPSGSLGLDLALGVGGYPRGRVIEIYGPESSGKTTLTLHAIAEAQKAGGIAAFIDAEHAFDRFYAENLGVDIENLIISQPDNGEQALEITDNLIRSGAIDIVVIDSVAALTPRSEIEGEMGDSKMGLHARLMSQALRKLTSSISKTNCTVMFINQLREKIGVMFGNPETTTGGNALKFYASVRIDIRRSTQIKESDGNVTGNKTRVKVVKNKVAPPFKTAEFDIMYGEGISKVGEILDLAVEFDIVKKSGSWFSYDETKLGQGRDAVKGLIKDNPELMEELEEKIKEANKANKKFKIPIISGFFFNYNATFLYLLYLIYNHKISNSIIMKKLIVICFILTVVWSCSLSDDSDNFEYELVPIESVSMPDTFIRGEIHTIVYTYYRPTTCHGFHNLYYVSEDNERIVGVVNTVFDNTNCEALEENSDNLIEKTFDFKPLNTGTYIFKFWQGLDENEEDMYLEYEILVEE